MSIVCVCGKERERSENKNIPNSYSYIFINDSNAAWHILSHILGMIRLWKFCACGCSHESVTPLPDSMVAVCVCVWVCALCIFDAYFSLTLLIWTRTELRKIIMGRDANAAQFIRLQMVCVRVLVCVCACVCVRACLLTSVCLFHSPYSSFSVPVSLRATGLHHTTRSSKQSTYL